MQRKKPDLLQKALSRSDFPALRAASPEPAGKSGARITLTDNGGRPPQIFIEGRPVPAEHFIRKRNTDR